MTTNPHAHSITCSFINTHAQPQAIYGPQLRAGCMVAEDCSQIQEGQEGRYDQRVVQYSPAICVEVASAMSDHCDVGEWGTAHGLSSLVVMLHCAD